jgi:inner membrane protein involved in colicin E2 resistance
VKYRATVYVLTPDSIIRQVIEERADSAEAFKQVVRDRWSSECNISFGPITQVLHTEK